MELGVHERLVLLGILPKEGDFLTLKIVRTLRENLSFSEEEHAALKFVQEMDGPQSGYVRWDTEAEKPKEFQIGEKASGIIGDVLKKMNAEKKLTDDHFGLYEKFVGE